MFLTPAELVELTGRRRPAAQARELRRRGYRFDVNALGHPVVSRAHTEAVLGGAARSSMPRAQSEPNWAAVK